MVCAGIVWGPAVKYGIEMNENFEKYVRLLYTFGLDLKDDYNHFVYDIYNEEDTPRWKVDKKVEMMKKAQETRVKIVFFDIDTTNQYYHDRKKCNVFTNVEKMKETTRNNYMDKIDDYFFDIIFHLTDNEKELTYTSDVILKYLQMIEKRDGVSRKTDQWIVQCLKNRDIKRLQGDISSETEMVMA